GQETPAPGAVTHCLVPRGTQTWPPMQPPATGAALSAQASAVGTTAGVTGAAEPDWLQVAVPLMALARKLMKLSTLAQLELVIGTLELCTVPPGQGMMLSRRPLQPPW